jgi:hypothetical protein
VRQLSLQSQTNPISNLLAFLEKVASVLLHPSWPGRARQFLPFVLLSMKLALVHLRKSTPLSGPCPHIVARIVLKVVLC